MSTGTIPRTTLRRREVAATLGVSTKTVDRMVKARKLSSFLDDGTRLIDAASVADYVARRIAEAEANP